MRTTEQINKTIEIIKKLWINNSDLRLTQLIQNCYGTNDIYFVEDEQLITDLKRTYGALDATKKEKRKDTNQLPDWGWYD